MMASPPPAQAIGFYTPDLRGVLKRGAAQTTYDVLAATLSGPPPRALAYTIAY